MGETKLHTITGDFVVKRCTARAILIDYEGEDVWLPRSQIKGDGSQAEEGEDVRDIVIPEWIAREKNLL